MGFLISVGERAKLIVNFVLVLLQLFVIAGFSGLFFSKAEVKEVNSGTIYNSDSFLTTTFLDSLVSLPVLVALFLVFCWSVFKEFYFKKRGKKIAINIALVCAFLGVYGVSAYILFSPLSKIS